MWQMVGSCRIRVNKGLAGEFRLETECVRDAAYTFHNNASQTVRNEDNGTFLRSSQLALQGEI